MSKHWIQTFSGHAFDLEDFRPGDVRAVDIARSLSMQCRYNGHVQKFYSVAEHSIRVAEIVSCTGAEPVQVIAALVHDAAEAYTPSGRDSPVKLLLQLDGLFDLEKRIDLAVRAHFNLPSVFDDTLEGMIGAADRLMLAVEKRDIMSYCPRPWETLARFGERLEEDPKLLDPRPIHDTMVPQAAEETFLRWLSDLEWRRTRAPKKI